MGARVLAIAEAAPGGLDHRSAAAPALAQRFIAGTGGEADLLVTGGLVPIAGLWRRVWRVGADDATCLGEALAGLLASTPYEAVFVGDTPAGRELAGRMASRLHLPVVASVLSVRQQGSVLQASRPAAGGARTANIALHGSPALLLVNPDAPAVSGSGGAVMPEAEELAVGGAPRPITLIGETRLLPWDMDLNEADVVVAGGRGVGGRDGFELLAELAGLLGGTVGASRVAVDAGWVPSSRQVGLTGRTVSPRLYIACGISGAIHHTLGMRSASFIVAINSDPRAPIFKIANVSIVGDAHEVIPQLIAEVRARASGGRTMAGART